MADTLAAPAQHVLVVRGSRFVADAAPIADADAAAHWLAAHHLDAATHNAWAWRCGARYRSSDDGEPGGSAGRPLLAAIDGQGLDQVVVRVARWFGGIKLGVGGLVRAYGGCAAACLRPAPRRPLRAQVRLRVRLDAAARARLYAQLARFEACAGSGGEDPILTLPADRRDELVAWLAALTRGAARCEILDAEDDTG